MAQSASFEDYYDGTVKAELTASDVDASWINDSHASNKLELLNTAFDLYYRARQNIKNCPDAGHKKQMKEELEDAATDGWGSGVQDLEDAFKHLAVNNGRWKDDNTAAYFNREGALYTRMATVNAPSAGVHFLESLEGRASPVFEALKHYVSWIGNLEELVKPTRIKQWDWHGIGMALHAIQAKGKAIKQYLWWAPPTLKDRLGQAVGLVETLCNIHSGATRAADLFGRSHTGGSDIAMDIALDVVAVALGRLPVLGSFYGHAVSLISGLENWFKGVIEARVRAIDSRVARY